jgi:hypothetical protein
VVAGGRDLESHQGPSGLATVPLGAPCSLPLGCLETLSCPLSLSIRGEVAEGLAGT